MAADDESRASADAEKPAKNSLLQKVASMVAVSQAGHTRAEQDRDRTQQELQAIQAGAALTSAVHPKLCASNISEMAQALHQMH